VFRYDGLVMRFLADSFVHTQGVALLFSVGLLSRTQYAPPRVFFLSFLGFTNKMGVTKGPSSGQGVTEVAVTQLANVSRQDHIGRV
jgi:hypothetical protein